MKKIQYLIYTKEVATSNVVRQFKTENVTRIPVLDVRTAIYYATGISAQSGEAVAVCVDGSNASRSAFSGMTEAFYRQLPVMLITVGKGVDYTIELRDVVMGHYLVREAKDIFSIQDYKFPVHIEVREEMASYIELECPQLQGALKDALSDNDYLYVSSEIKINNDDFACKCIKGEMYGCKDGTLSNILGASLAQKRRRYIGIITEEEFLHDMNTLGNIHANDRLFFIVLADEFGKMIGDYAKTLNYKVVQEEKKDICAENLRVLLDNKKQTVLILYL